MYYRTIISLYRERNSGPTYPRILINSIDSSEMLGHLGAGRLDDLTTLLAASIEALARAGADVALVAANTPHVVFDALREQSPLPLINIVEATCFCEPGTVETPRPVWHSVHDGRLVLPRRP